MLQERKNSARLTEALEGYKRDNTQSGDYQQKCAVLERELQEATHALATHEVKVSTSLFSRSY